MANTFLSLAQRAYIRIDSITIKLKFDIDATEGDYEVFSRTSNEELQEDQRNLMIDLNISTAIKTRQDVKASPKTSYIRLLRRLI